MPHEPGHEGRTKGQALINRAVSQRKYIDEIEDYQDEQQDWLDDKSSKSGWGRFFGALIAGGAVAISGGAALPIAVAAGFGSRLGNEGGEWLADRDKPTELDEDKILYYKDEVKQIKRDEESFERDFDRRQWFDAARDAWTAYNISSTAAKYGAEVETLADGSKVYAEQTPWEGAKKMWGDSGSWVKDLKSGSLGKGKELGKGARIRPESGDLNKWDVPYGSDPIIGNAGKTVGKAAGRRLTREEMVANNVDEIEKLSADILGNSFETDPKAVNNNWLNWFN